MTRPRSELELARFYVDWGLNNCEIERITGISRTTVREWRHRIGQGLTNSSFEKIFGSSENCPRCSGRRSDGCHSMNRVCRLSTSVEI